MFVVVCIASGLFGEREKKLWKRAQRSHERAVKVSRCFRPYLLGRVTQQRFPPKYIENTF